MDAFLCDPAFTLLVLVRISVALYALPALGVGTRFRSARLVLAVFLTGLSLPHLLEVSAQATTARVPVYVISIMREVLVGIFLGFVTSMAMEVARFSGSLIARDMGMGIAEMADPLTGSRSGTMAFFMEVLALILFFRWNGHHWLLQGVMESFERVPVGAAVLDEAAFAFLVHLLSSLFSGALVLAAPVLCVLTLVTVSMALVARAVPQMNVLEAGFAWRVAGAILALMVFFPLIGQGFLQMFARAREVLFTALDYL